jgi:hypothetical protein
MVVRYFCFNVVQCMDKNRPLQIMFLMRAVSVSDKKSLVGYRVCKGKVSCTATRHEGALGGGMYSSYLFLTSALDGGEWSASRLDRALPPGKGPPVPITHWIGGWVGPRAGLDAGG